jgi:hypothetical protein
MKGNFFAYTHFVANNMKIHWVYFFSFGIEQIYKFEKIWDFFKFWTRKV